MGLFLWLAWLQCGFGQTDTNVIAIGGWSDPVSDGNRGTLRGRVLVYDDQGPGAANHARVYLELQHPFQGAWFTPIEVYFNLGFSDDLHFEMRDGSGRPIPQEPVNIRGPLPNPYWVTLPCDSTVRLRADSLFGPQSKPDGLEIMVWGGCWLIPPNATNDFFLSATFTPPKDHPTPLHYHVWQGTLKLPKVKIPARKP